MIKLSASLIKDYLWCKRKGYYRINYPEQAIKTDDMIIGEIVHKVIEEDWNKDLNFALEHAHELIKNYNILDPNPTRLGAMDRCIKNFFINFGYLISDKDEIERYFKVPFSDDVVMVGKMDRITKDRIIIDWKTGGTLPKSIDNDIQFIIYYMSYKQLYGEYPKKTFLISLNRGKIVEFDPKLYYIRFLYGEVIPKIIEDIGNGRFERTGLYNNSCLNCPFQLTCWSEL